MIMTQTSVIILIIIMWKSWSWLRQIAWPLLTPPIRVTPMVPKGDSVGHDMIKTTLCWSWQIMRMRNNMMMMILRWKGAPSFDVNYKHEKSDDDDDASDGNNDNDEENNDDPQMRGNTLWIWWREIWRCLWQGRLWSQPLEVSVKILKIIIIILVMIMIIIIMYLIDTIYLW